jgi:hypothetical protein
MLNCNDLVRLAQDITLYYMQGLRFESHWSTLKMEFLYYLTKEKKIVMKISYISYILTQKEIGKKKN